MHILEEYSKIFKALVKESKRSKPSVFASLGTRSNLGISYTYSYKESYMKRYPWVPLDYFILELIITSSIS